MPSSLSSLFHFENDDHNCKDNDNDSNNKINNNDNYNNCNNNYNEKVRVSLASTLQKIQPTIVLQLVIEALNRQVDWHQYLLEVIDLFQLLYIFSQLPLLEFFVI